MQYSVLPFSTMAMSFAEDIPDMLRRIKRMIAFMDGEIEFDMLRKILNEYKKIRGTFLRNDLLLKKLVDTLFVEFP